MTRRRQIIEYMDRKKTKVMSNFIQNSKSSHVSTVDRVLVGGVTAKHLQQLFPKKKFFILLQLFNFRT